MEMAGIENTAAYHEKEKSRPGESSRPAFCTDSPGMTPAKVDGKVPVKRTDAVMNEKSAAGRCRLSVIVPVFNMATEERLSLPWMTAAQILHWRFCGSWRNSIRTGSA